MTAFTLAQVADVEKQAAKEHEASFITEYRFLHGKLASILSGNTGRTTDNVSFNSTFAATVTSFRSTLASKGFDSLFVLGGSGAKIAKSECTFVVPACPETTGGDRTLSSWNGVVPTGGTVGLTHKYDGVNDGLAFLCAEGTGSLVAAVVHVYLSDAKTSLSETIVIPLNGEWYATTPWPACA